MEHVVQENLAIAVSVASFRANPIETYKSELKVCLQEFVASSKLGGDANAIITYKFDAVTFCAIVPWTEVCQHWDDYHQQQSSTGSSPLRIFLRLICDPTLVPFACQTIVVQWLLHGIMSAPKASSLRWSPSQELIFHTLHQLQKTRPSLLSTIDGIFTDLLESPTVSHPPAYWNRFLSVLERLSPPSFISQLLLLIEKSDEYDRTLYKEPRSSESVKLHRPNPKRMPIASVSDLHDVDWSTPNYSRQAQHVSANVQQHRPGTLLKTVLSATPAKASKSSRKQFKEYDPSPWTPITARALRKFQSCLFPNLRYRPFHLFLQIKRHRLSPILRLCLLWTSPAQVLPWIWNQIMHVSSVSSEVSKWLRMYSELVVDWAPLERRDECWKAFQPLLEWILKHDESLDPVWFSCLGYLLARRAGRMLETGDDDIGEKFQMYIARLRVNYGEVHFWFQHNEQVENSEKLWVLQHLGILGLVATALPEQEQPPNAISVHPALREWPFAPEYRLRTAYERVIAPNKHLEGYESLLSKEDNDNPSSFDPKRKTKQRASAPMLQYLDQTDLLVLIFSFVGPSGLGPLRQVCSHWRDVVDSSNHLWYQVYAQKFGIVAEDSNANPPHHVQQNWKDLFQRKWVAQRSLEHRRHQATGWKHRICAYVGCYHVLKCERLQISHYQSHERKKQKSPKKRAAASPTPKSKKPRVSCKPPPKDEKHPKP